MSTGSSVVTLDTRTVPGGSLAEHLFHTSINGYVKCDHCSLPVFEIKGECIVIFSRHYGSKHISVIPLEKMGLRFA